MERDQATKLVHGLLKKMVDKNGSDLFITTGFPPAIKIDGEIHRAAEQPLSGDDSAIIVRSIMNDRQARDFDATKECNFAIGPQGIGRFRVSAFVQQRRSGCGAAPDRHEDSDARGAGAAAHHAGNRADQARPGDRRRCDRFGQVNDACGDGSPSQHEHAWSHRHHRGPVEYVHPHKAAASSRSAKWAWIPRTGTPR
jgi:hypothetical protein